MQKLLSIYSLRGTLYSVRNGLIIVICCEAAPTTQNANTTSVPASWRPPRELWWHCLVCVLMDVMTYVQMTGTSRLIICCIDAGTGVCRSPSVHTELVAWQRSLRSRHLSWAALNADIRLIYYLSFWWMTTLVFRRLSVTDRPIHCANILLY